MARTVLVDLTPLGTPTRLRGIGRYLRMLAAGLSRLTPDETQGLRLVALTGLDLRGRARLSEDLSSAADDVRPTTPTQLDRYRWAYTRRVALWAAARQVRADLVHLGDPNSTPIGLRAIGCRRLSTCHDLIPLQFPEIYLGIHDGFGFLGKRIIRRRYRSADAVLAISNATRAELMRLLGIDESRILVAHNGIDLRSFEPAPKQDDQARVHALGLKGGGYVLYVGDTDWRKNVAGMMAALAAARRRGMTLDIAFAGKLEEHKIEAIHRQAAEHGVQPAVRMLGFVPDADLQALYRRALAHLFVSRYEGFGYTVVEAMASGCPVVTTRCGSLAEVAQDAGELVDPNDAEGMADALWRLGHDEGHRAEMVRRGLDRAKRFSCEEQARATVRAYRSALGERPQA